jgi:Skp family chaperone for outer membrane proteins
LALGIAFVVIPAGAQEKAQFAVLDYSIIIRDYYRAVESKQRFEKKQEELKKDMEERENAVNQIMKDAKKLQDDLQSPALSETKKKEITGQLKDKLSELDGRQRMAMDFRNQSLMVFQKSQANEQETLMADINKALGVIAKNKYTIVFAKASIPFSEGIDDITQQVLALLNKDAPAASKKEEKK